jgi:hypothetical protein
MQALTGYGETAISGHLHPFGIQVLATPREASVCVRNRFSTVPDTIFFLLSEAPLGTTSVSLVPASAGRVVESSCSVSMDLWGNAVPSCHPFADELCEVFDSACLFAHDSAEYLIAIGAGRDQKVCLGL